MTPLVDGKTYYAATLINLINNELHKIILTSALLFAGFAILAPLASAQQRDSNRANLNPNPNLNFDSTYKSSQFRRTCNQSAGSCDLLEFSHDHVDRGALDSDDGGSNASLLSGDAVACAKVGTPNCQQESRAIQSNEPEDSKNQPSEKRVPRSKPADFNGDIYYKNKLEFSLDGGWLPINIPFPFDVFEGDPYDLYPLRYTLVPIVASLRWHMDDIGSRWILRGNWDLTFSASATAIPRGAETHYFSYDMGIRRNFVPRNSRVAPYVDMRLGLGLIDAKGPLGVYYAQGQNYTFTANMGSGVRYNFNPRYAISAGLNWMHISNNNLSAPQYSNYGINVYGPMVGIDIQLRKQHRHSAQ